MIEISKIIRFSVLVAIASILLVNTACKELTDNIVWPKNEIISQYISPKIDSYKINSIALLPIPPDDTTNVGTFYSTNYFINSLEDKYPKIKFTVSDIDTAISIDSLAISQTIYSIEKEKKLNLKKFYNSELGYDVKKDSVDAIILGVVDSCSKKGGFLIKNYRLDRTRIISCRFTYYLISMKDGRVLWKADVLGEAGYLYDGASEIYPPLDRALSNGIKILLNTIPLK